MTPKKIYQTDPGIRKRVMEAYPVSKGEKKCAMERAKKEMKRAELAKRLYDGSKGQAIEGIDSNMNKLIESFRNIETK